MKKIKYILSILGVAMLLVACGGKEPETPNQQEEIIVIDEPGEVQEEEEKKKEKESPKPEEQLPSEKEIDVHVEGNQEKRKAVLKESQLGYFMYVLDRFSLEQEEPGKDVVLSEYDDNFFLRIEVLDSEANLEELKENTKLALEDIGNIQELNPKDIFDPYFHSAKMYMVASSEKVSVTYLVMDIDGKLFRFMFHTPSAEAAEGIVPSFWAMVKTIGIK